MAAALAVLVSGCQCKTEPPKNVKPLPVNAAPAPIKPGPGETAASTLVRKADASPYVKVRRDKDGRYTWDISGKDVGQILKADRELRRSLGDGTKTAD